MEKCTEIILLISANHHLNRARYTFISICTAPTIFVKVIFSAKGSTVVPSGKQNEYSIFQ